MSKLTTICLLAVMLVVESCTQYSSRSVPVSEVINTGAVKVVMRNGKRAYYKNLFPGEEDMVEFSKNDSLLLTIDTSNFAAVYPKLKRNTGPVKLWIKRLDGVKISGYLAYAGDSSIGYTLHVPRKKFVPQLYQEIEVQKIQYIAFRKQSAPATGALVGLLAPFLFTIPASGGDLSDYGYALMILHLPAAVIGGLIGTSRQKIMINGEMDNYKFIKHRLIKVQPPRTILQP